jgi:hypothetical protein
MRAFVANGPGEPSVRLKDWQFQLAVAQQQQQNIHKENEGCWKAP